MDKIRLMQVTQDLGVSGLERVVVTICQSIDRDLFEPMVLTIRGRGPLAKELDAIGVEVVDIGGTFEKGDYFAFWKVARELRKRRIDVIHTHNSLALFDGFAAARVSGVRAHVHTDHARNFPDKRRYMIAEHLTSYFVDQIVAVSSHTRDNLIRYEKIAPHRIMTIPNGIVADRQRNTCSSAGKRAELGITGGPVIGLITRLTEQKGVIYLLQALTELRKQFPELMVVIAGWGDLEESLKQASVELGVQDNVRFLGTRSDVAELLQTFDVFAIPSIWEGLPMAMLEAMAWGCPVVSTDVGGIGSVLRHRQNGSLVPARDPSALANELATVLGNAELRARYRTEGLKTFQENYSAEVMTRRYEQVYLDCLGARGRTRAAQSANRSAPANELAASRGRPS